MRRRFWRPIFILIILIVGLKFTANIRLNLDNPQKFNKISVNTFQQLEKSNCTELKLCYCSEERSYVTINCLHLNNFTEFMSTVRKKFSNQKIVQIYITHSSFDYLPAKAFANLTINKIFIIKSSIGLVDNDVFSGINGLVELKFDNMKYTKFPTSISCANATLKVLWMKTGELQVIGKELMYFSRMQVISFKKNQIRTIDPEAFFHMTELIKLDLSNNSIKSLHPSTFSTLQSLKYLNLMENDIESVKDLFNKLQFTLKKLKLQGNKIKNIDNLTDRPLYSLQALYLTENPLEVITKNSFGINFPRLQNLYLEETQLTRVEFSAFQYMTRLRRVMLNHNKLSHLDKNIFANLDALNTISLSENHIKTIKNLFTHNKRLTNLILNYNDIDDIKDCIQSNSDLKILYLNHNKIQRIYSNTFKNNNNLVSLSLDHNRIEYLERDSFYGLMSLKILIMSSNKIDNLNNSLNNLPQLQELYLNDNLLISLDLSDFEKIIYLYVIDISYNRLIYVEKAFIYLKNLKNFKINNNFINTLTYESFSSQAPLKNLELRNNPLKCDCRIEWLVNLILQNDTKVDKATCSEPKWLKYKRISTLKLNDIRIWISYCPHDCDCLCETNFVDYLIYVNCYNKELAEVPKNLPERMITLDLRHNKITEIPEFLRNFSQLEYLYLDFNNLTTLPDLANLYLKTLTLSNNRFTRFPIKNIKAQYLEIISLSENPWICDCQTLPFVKWMLYKKDKIIDINQTKCNSNNEKLKLQKIVLLTEHSLCPSLIVFYSIIAVCVAILLLSIAGGKIIYIKYRMYIQVWLYSRGFSCIKEDDLDENKQFDAFVSYSCFDEFFVLSELVPMLESGEKPYFLCLHFRNFVPGSYIQENIINAVKASKRTILVLSKNFLSSEWCRLEFKSAHQQVLEERLNRLIVIILGDLPPDDDIDPEIQLYLKTTTYLRWRENNFWNKLKYAMPKTPCDITLSESTPLLGNYD